MSAGSFALTQTERDAYEEDGFFVRREAYSADEMDRLQRRVASLVQYVEASDELASEQKELILRRNDRATAQTGEASLNSLFRVHMFSREIRAHMRGAQRLAAVRPLLGSDLFCPNDLYFLKPPGSGRPIAWHQDSWYFRNIYEASDGSPIEDASVGTWLAIDDATVENGCLRVLPGSHRAGVVDHLALAMREQLPVQHHAGVTPEMEASATPVEVPKGSLVFFNNALLHCSASNDSDTFRRAYVVHYMKSIVRDVGVGASRQRERVRQWGWSTIEAYICGRSVRGCVQTTPEKECLNWDA